MSAWSPDHTERRPPGPAVRSPAGLPDLVHAGMYAVDDNGLPSCLEVTHRNLNDNTIEGLRHRELPAFSVQYHPEASAGPHDSGYLFREFVELMQK